MNGRERFVAARDILLDARSDYARARAAFRWPELSDFNWAADYFDTLRAAGDREALIVRRDDARVRRARSAN